MKAFILDRYGSADRVRAGDMPDPELREDDVLVQIHAAGVNLLDSKIRIGRVQAHSAVSPAAHFGQRRGRGRGSESERECGDSSPATKSMRGRTRIESVHSRSSSAIKEDVVAMKPKNLTHGRGGLHPFGWTDRLASADRESKSEEGAEGFHPRRLRRRRHLRDSAGQSTSARRWRRRRARTTWIWSRASAPTSSSITRRTTSKTSSATTTWS